MDIWEFRQHWEMCRISHSWARDQKGWTDHWGHYGTQEQVMADEMGHFLGQQWGVCASTSRLAGHGSHFGDVTGTTAAKPSHSFNGMWGFVLLLSHGASPGLWKPQAQPCAVKAGDFILCKIAGRNLFWSFSERSPPGWQAALSLCSVLPGICTCKMHKIRTSLHLPNSL